MSLSLVDRVFLAEKDAGVGEIDEIRFVLAQGGIGVQSLRAAVGIDESIQAVPPQLCQAVVGIAQPARSLDDIV